ncbi:MAG: lysophospholipid acyltransferase family protein [Oscillospiraceae bacterium]
MNEKLDVKAAEQERSAMTEQEKLDTRRLHPVNKTLFRAMALLTRLLFKKKYGVTFTYAIDRAQYRDKPYVLVSNHASRADYVFTGLAMWPDAFNYVVGYNEFFRGHLARLLRALQVVPKKNFTPQPYAVKQMLRIIKEGGRIMIMPEGMSSISGGSQPCALGGGRLFKRLGVPVLYTKIAGGYLTNPKYCLDERPGKVEVTVDLLFSPEQLEALSADELQAEMNAKLRHDDYEWNKTARVKYDGHGEMAKNLHQLLFWCPKCGAELQMQSEGNSLTCRACGNGATLNEYCDLIPNGPDCVIPETPSLWFDEQRAHVRELVRSSDYVLTEHIKLGELPKHGFLKKDDTSIPCGEGTLTLNREGLRYDGTRNGAHFEFFVPIKRLPTYGMCTDVSRFYTFVDGEFLEFFPERESAELWFMATEELHRQNGGAWQDYPDKLLRSGK